MELLFFLSSSLFTLLLLLLLFRRFNPISNPQNHNLHLLPPSPPTIPFIGNWQFFSSSPPPVSLWSISKKYGPIFSLRVGRRRIIVITSEKITQEAIRDMDTNFSGRVQSRGVRKLCYEGSDIAFSEYGEYWRQIRKVAVLNLFSAKRVQSYREIREEYAGKMRELVMKAAEGGGVLDVNELLVSLNSKLICRMAFGESCCMGGGGWEEGRFSSFFNETQAMLGGTFMEDYWPVLGKWVDFITGMNARLGRNFREMDSFFNDVIRNHLSRDVGKQEEVDFLDILLKLNRDGHISLNQVKGVLIDVVVGGTDTSAAAVTWAMTELMRNPEEMGKLQKEVRGVMGDGKEIVKEEEMGGMEYMKAVIKEVLRLHPPAPLLLPRECVEGCTLGGYHIPAKATLIINCWGIGREGGWWSEPSRFWPERFVGSKVEYMGRHFGFIPFGVGRRICPGIALAAATVQLLLANLIYSFDWHLPPGVGSADIDDDMLPGIAMHKKNHLLLIPKKTLLSTSLPY